MCIRDSHRTGHYPRMFRTAWNCKRASCGRVGRCRNQSADPDNHGDTSLFSGDDTDLRIWPDPSFIPAREVHPAVGKSGGSGQIPVLDVYKRQEYRNSVLTDNEIAMLSEDMERFNQELLKARTIFQQLRMAAKKLTRVEESELLKERDMLTDEKAKAAERAGLLSARRIRNEGAYRNLQKLMEERRKLKEEKRCV